MRGSARKQFRLRSAAWAITCAFGFSWPGGVAALDPNALPTGGNVASGVASISQTGAQMTVQQQTGRAIIDWATFNIGSQAAVNFRQPGASSAILNRVAMGGGASQILGSLSSNGQVFLINPAGTLFARGAQVNVGSLAASSLGLSNENFIKGNYRFESGGTAGNIVNQGTLRAADGGYIALLAPEIRNEGVISAKLGTVALGAGDAITLEISGGSLLDMKVERSSVDALIANQHLVEAPDGRVLMSARAAGQLAAGVINNTGEIRAERIAEVNGVVRLEAGDVNNAGLISTNGKAGGSITLAAERSTVNTGVIVARGSEAHGGEVRLLGDKVGLFGAGSVDASGAAGGGTILLGGNFQGKGPEKNSSMTVVARDATLRADAWESGNGGRIIVWSDDQTIFAGTLTARGGSLGGDGGFAEVSGKKSLTFIPVSVRLDAPGGRPGNLLLDPQDIIVQAGGPAIYTDVSTFAANTGTTQTIDPATLDAVGANVTLQADNSITVINAVNLTTPGAGLTAQAGGDIFVNSPITTNGGAISLSARDPGGVVTPPGSVNILGALASNGGAISITNNGGPSPINISGTLNAGAGNISLQGGAILSTAGISTSGTLTTSTINGQVLAGANSIGAVDLSNLSGGGIALNNSGPLTVVNLVNTDPASGISVTNVGGISINGTANVTSAGTGGLTLSASGAGSDLIVNANGLGGPINSGGPVALTAGRDISLSRSIAGTAAGMTLNAGGGIAMQPGTSNSNLLGSGGAVQLTAGSAIALNDNATVGSGIITTGTVSLTASGITEGSNNKSQIQAGTLNVNSTAGPVSLTSTLNAIGALGFSAGAGGVAVTNTGALNLLASNTGGGLSINNTGAITQSGALIVGGNASINAGAGSITLTAANDFQGTVALSNSGLNPVQISDVNSISFAPMTLGGPFTVNAPVIVASDTTTFGSQTWNGGVTFNSTETTNGGSFTVTGSTLMGHSLVINTGSGNVILIGNVNGTTYGIQGLTINSSGTLTFNGTVGGITPLSFFLVNGSASTLGNAVTVSGSQSSTLQGVISQLSSSLSGSSSGAAGTITVAMVDSAGRVVPIALDVGSRPTTSGGFSMQLIQLVDQLVAQARAQLFSSALSQIARDRTLADVPDCGDSGGENCIKRGNSEKAVELAANETPVIKRKIALLFGNDKYLAPIPSLDTPGNDVEAVGKALSEKLGYETRIVRDAKRADIVRELNWLIGEAGADDSVYIGYAGHGFQAEKDSSGYWIPSDASNNDAAGWISNSAIAKFIKNIPARQVILVSDSCYSGTLAQEQKVQTSDTTVFDRNDVLRKRSVMVMSSGGNEPVADGGHENHSIFAYHLLRNLAAIDGNLVGSDIHRKVSAAVRKEYPQEPQYGVLLTAGHVQGGEYLIEKK